MRWHRGRGGGRGTVAVLLLCLAGLAVPPGPAAGQAGCPDADGRWRAVDTGVAAPHTVVVDHDDPDLVAVADDRAVAVSTDGGCGWVVTVALEERADDGAVVPDLQRIVGVDLDGGAVAVAIRNGPSLAEDVLVDGSSVPPQATSVLHSATPADPATYRTVLVPTSPAALAGALGSATALTLQDGRIGLAVQQPTGDVDLLAGDPAEGTWQRWATVPVQGSDALLAAGGPGVDRLAWEVPADGSDGRLLAAGPVGVVAASPDGAEEVGPGVGALRTLATTTGRVLVGEQRPVLHDSRDGALTWTPQPGPDAGSSPSALAVDDDTVLALLPGVRSTPVALRHEAGAWQPITPPDAPLLTSAAVAQGPAGSRTDVWVAGPGGVHHLGLSGDVAPPTGEVPDDLDLGIVAVTPTPPRPATVTLDRRSLALDVGATAEVTLTVDLPPRPGPVDVAFLADETGSMGAFLRPLRDEFAGIVRTFADRHVDARYGVAVYELFGPDGYVYDRRTDVVPPGPELARGLRGLDARPEGNAQGAGGANLATAMVEGLHQAATGAGYEGRGVTIPPGEGFTFRPGTSRVLLHATDMSHDPSGGGATFAEAVASLQDAGIVQAGVFVANAHANPSGYAELVTLAEQTGALAAAPVDCDGDGQPDVDQGDPLVCGAPTGAVPRGEEIPDGQLPAAIVDLALAAPELADLTVRASDVPVRVAVPAATPVDVRRHTSTAVRVAITCPALAVTTTVRLSAALPAEPLGEVTLPVTCRPPGLADIPPPAEPPAPTDPVTSTTGPVGPQPAADVAVPPPAGGPPAAVQVPAAAPAQATAPGGATSTATGTAPAAGLSTGTTSVQAGAVVPGGAPAGATSVGSGGAGGPGGGTTATGAQARREEALQVRTVDGGSRRLPFSASVPVGASMPASVIGPPGAQGTAAGPARPGMLATGAVLLLGGAAQRGVRRRQAALLLPDRTNTQMKTVVINGGVSSSQRGTSNDNPPRETP